MNAPASRRGFLRGLTTLPLIGGSVALIGSPSAVAAPITDRLLDTYDTFLFYERCRLNAERYGENGRWRGTDYDVVKVREALRFVALDNAAVDFHADEGFLPVGPGARAALVLSAVGCGWREGTPCG